MFRILGGLRRAFGARRLGDGLPARGMWVSIEAASVAASADAPWRPCIAFWVLFAAAAAAAAAALRRQTGRSRRAGATYFRPRVFIILKLGGGLIYAALRVTPR